MKKNRVFLSAIIFYLIGSSFFANAGGGSLIKNGGRGIVCLPIGTPLLTFLNYNTKTEKLTALGRKNVISAEPLEYFLAKNNYEPGSAFEKIKDMSYDAALTTLHEVFKPYPWFYDSLIFAHEFLGPVERGAAMSADGVENSDDALKTANTPKNCIDQQIVISIGDFFTIDQLYWSKLSPSQKAILQLHEEIYYLARVSSDVLPKIYHGDVAHGSSETTRLIAAMLMTNTPDVDIPRIFKKSVFKAPEK